MKRLQLRSLEIQGFKSFPDRTKLTFGEGITAVVGPNGSGKSNISDAVRWVLGEKSSKSLRGTKMEDVVFNGTQKRKQMGYAEVTLTIDNTARTLPYDEDTVAVTRRYYRSGESEYQINGNTVRLRDVHELFMDTGLGQDGYSIVGQGRIAEIVAAKSDDRREIFEEAAGISRFRSKKEESERHLKVAEENLSRLLDILTELESRVEPLREQSEKAKRFLEYNGEKNGLEIALSLVQLERGRDQLRDVEYKLRAAQAQYQAAAEKIEALAGENEEVYLQQQKLAARTDEIRRAAQQMEEQATQREAEVAVLRNDMRRDEEIRQRIAGDLSAAQDADAGFDALVAQRQERIKTREEEIRKLEASLETLNAELLESVTRTDALAGELETHNRRLSELTVAVSERRVQLSTAQTAVEELDERAASVAERREQLAARAERAREELETLQQEQAAQTVRQESLRNAEGGYAIKLENRRKKREEKEEAVRRLALRLSEKQQRAEMLSNLERQLEGFAGSVKTVMRESERGRLRGVIGPVSRVVTVPDDYAVAVETALGAALQNIVVETENDAKAAIGYLKQQDAGRATFLPLSSVRGNLLDERGVAGQPGYVGVAARLVQYEARFEGVVHSLLGRIAVVRDLDAGIALARKNQFRFRIVTLDGQIINAGGSFTGGSVGRNAGLLTRSRDIEKLQQEAAALQTQLDAASEEKRRISEETAALEAEYLGLKSELQTCAENLIRLDGELKLRQDQAEAADSMLSSLEEEAADAAQRREAQLAQIAQTQQALSELSEQMTQAEEAVTRLSGGQSQLAARREAQSQEIASIRLQVMEIRKDIDADEQAIADVEVRRQEQKSRAGAYEEEIRTLEEKTRQDEEKIQALLAEAAALREQAKASETGVAEVARERETLEKRVTQIGEEQKAAYNEREKIGGEVGRLEERRANLSRDYDKIIASLLEEHQLTRSEAEAAAPKIEDVPQAQRRLAELKNKIKALGSVNVGAIEEYKEVYARYAAMKEQYDDVEQSRKELLHIISDVTSKMKTIFGEEFARINLNFTETFRELFGGGTAQLRLTDPDDVLTSGIEIDVAPPGKIINNLASLSGGEQAMVAMAIYFAILKVRPAPFCILDEVETALDDVNVSRFAAYLNKMSDRTQFIAITHRRGTMEMADRLYGVTMQEEGVSKLLVMNVSEMAKDKQLGAIIK